MDRQVKGILGAKLGMTQVWDNNKVVPVTVVQAGPCVVTQVRTPDKDGYSAVQLAFGAIDPRKVNKPMAGHFAKADVAPRRHIVELRTTDASEYDARPGGHRRDVRRRPADRRHRQDQGQGLRRRHEAARLPRPAASHGVERKHRSPGSIGACATPGRVFKGVRMAGRMGGVRYTVQNLTVQAVDPSRTCSWSGARSPARRARWCWSARAAKSAGEEGRCGEVTTVDVRSVDGDTTGIGRAAGRHLRRRRRTSR